MTDPRDADIAAAYAAGRAAYAAEEANQHGTAYEATSAPVRAPGPVIAAAVLTVFAGAVLVLGLVTDTEDGWIAYTVAGVGFLLYAAAGYGLWRGSNPVRWIVIVLAALTAGLTSETPSLLSAAVGVALVLLLTAPESSRAWFSRR